MNNLKIATRLLPNKNAIVSFKGILDGDTYGEAEEAINLLFDKGVRNLLIDLSGLAYINCAGTGVFISAWKEVKENNGNIIFTRPNKSVRDIFNILGLTHIFNISNNTPASLLNMAKKEIAANFSPV